MHDELAAAGHEVRVVGRGPLPDGARRASVFAGSPVALLEAVRDGSISADGLGALVLDDARALEPARSAVEALLQASDDRTRRIAATHRRNAAFDDLVAHWLPRARRWPAEFFKGAPTAALPAPAAGSAPPRPVAVASRATRRTRLARLTELLLDIAASGETDIGVETPPGAVSEVRTAIAVTGLGVARPDQEAGAGGAGENDDTPRAYAPIRVGAWGQLRPARAAVVFELPPAAADLGAAMAGAARRYAIVDTAHERQLELALARAGLPMTPLADTADPRLMDDVDDFRSRVAEAIRQQDLASGTLLLAPLLEEYGSARVAAALAGLLRASRLSRLSGAAPPADVAPPQKHPLHPGSKTERATRPTWTRLYIGAGKRHGVGPGDLVGAITGETGAAGGQIGRIDIRHSFSLVEVDSMAADDIIGGLDGRQIKGTEVAVRRERGKARK